MTMKTEPEIADVSLVLLGNFNPAIFTPAWFGWQDLLPKQIVESATLKHANPQLIVFEADWLHIHVDPERFIATTSQSPYSRLQDLVVHTFQKHLLHTPLRNMGINRSVHFLVQNMQVRDKLGRQLAPTGPWGDWGRKLEPDGRHGGMRSITMMQVNPDDRPPGGEINVTIEPSSRIGGGKTGVYVRVNDHYAWERQTTDHGIIDLLELHFDKSLKRADKIVNHIMSLTEE